MAACPRVHGGEGEFDDDVVSGTQHSQVHAVADSYAVTCRVPLPSAPYASVCPGQRQVHDRLKPCWVSTFPNVHRFYDEKSRAIAHVAWEFVEAEEVWAIVTCKLLGAGQKETMGWYKNAATTWVHGLISKYVAMQQTQQEVKDKVLFVLFMLFILFILL